MTKTTTPVDDVPRLDDEFLRIRWDRIIAAEDNVRDEIGDITELAASIRSVGLLTPLLVTPYAIDHGDDTIHYRIIAGHRRFAACLNNAMAEISCMVRAATGDDERVATMLVENLQRQDLNPIEEAYGFQRLTKELRWKQADVARRIGRSPSYVSSRLLLLQLPVEVIDQVRIGKLPLQTAEKLTQIKDSAIVLALTNAGKRVPTDALITEAINKAAIDAVVAMITKAANARDIEVTKDYLSAWKVKVIAEIERPEDLDTLTAASLKKARLYVDVKPWLGTVKFTLARELTDKEREKINADADAERQKQLAERQSHEAAREAVRRAALSDEMRAWEDACDQARAEHEEALAQFRDKSASLSLGWASSLDAKVVAKWAMLAAIAECNGYQLARELDLQPVEGEMWEATVQTYCLQSGANMVKAAALAVVINDREYNDADGPASEDLAQFIRKQKLVEPVLVLPPSPENPDGDAEVSQEEADAIRAQQDAAAEAAMAETDDEFYDIESEEH